MHLKGKEKHFWRNNFSIGNLADIPLVMNEFRAIDDETDDQFLLYLTSRIPTIHRIYFKFTNVTDEGVKYISNIKGLQHLTLRDHKSISNASIPYLNKLIELEYLDILKTEIHLEDLPGLTDLKKLKELYISSGDSEEDYIIGQVVNMKRILPNCILYIDYKSYE